jgi:hypothetical protein
MTRRTAILRYGVPGLILGIVFWSVFGTGRVLEAQGVGGRPGLPSKDFDTSSTSGVIVTTIASGMNQRMFVVDTKKQVIAVYDFSAKSMRLVAIRRYQADLGLTEFNNDEPRVSDIQKTLESMSGR